MKYKRLTPTGARPCEEEMAIGVDYNEDYYLVELEDKIENGELIFLTKDKEERK